MMKIAVTSQNRKTITAHAGKCRKFWLYKIAEDNSISRELIELGIDETFHATGKDNPHPLDSIDVLMTAGMGQGLQRRLQAKGTVAVVTEELDPDTAVNLYLSENSAG